MISPLYYTLITRHHPGQLNVIIKHGRVISVDVMSSVAGIRQVQHVLVQAVLCYWGAHVVMRTDPEFKISLMVSC